MFELKKNFKMKQLYSNTLTIECQLLLLLNWILITSENFYNILHLLSGVKQMC